MTRARPMGVNHAAFAVHDLDASVSCDARRAELRAKGIDDSSGAGGQD